MSSPGNEVRALAEALVTVAGHAVVARCESDPGLAEAVSRAAAALLVERATAHRVALSPEQAVWPRPQDGLVALAAIPGAVTDLGLLGLDPCTRPLPW